MDITLPKSILVAMLQDAAQLGANSAMVKAGLLKPYLSKNAAFKQYGRAKVEGWIKKDLITPRKIGNNTSQWSLDRAELEALALVTDRHSYKLIKIEK